MMLKLGRRACTLLLSGALSALVLADTGENPAPGTTNDAGAARQGQWARGWAALRAMDCARCHGRDHDGWAAPSLITAVRDGSRERFMHLVLEGDIARGMPPYRSQPLVVKELDSIYAYLVACAEGWVSTCLRAPSSVQDR
jgi:mono/diheme cytochrome c family protein